MVMRLLHQASVTEAFEKCISMIFHLSFFLSSLESVRVLGIVDAMQKTQTRDSKEVRALPRRFWVPDFSIQGHIVFLRAFFPIVPARAPGNGAPLKLFLLAY